MIEKKQKEIIEKMKDELFHVAKEDVTGFAWLCKLYVDSIDRKLEKNECVNLLVNEISELGLSDKMKTEVKEYAEFCKKNDLHDDFINNLDKASDEALDLKKEEEERIKKMKKDEKKMKKDEKMYFFISSQQNKGIICCQIELIPSCFLTLPTHSPNSFKIRW